MTSPNSFFRKILVVDDSELIHRMYDLIFMRYRQKGTVVVHAMNGKEAIDRLLEHKGIDILLLDINMPVMSGLEFLKHRKERHLFEDVPVIIVSTEGHEEDTIRGLKAGATAYVKKPFQPSDLHSIMERVAGQRAAS